MYNVWITEMSEFTESFLIILRTFFRKCKDIVITPFVLKYFRLRPDVIKITMTMDVSKSETNKNGSTQQECAGCGKTITER